MFPDGSPLGDRFEHRIERLQRHFGQESKRPQVHAQQRNIHRGRDSRRRQQCSIATQHHHQIQRLRLPSSARHYLLSIDIFRRLLIDDDLVAMLGEPRQQSGKNLRDFRRFGREMMAAVFGVDACRLAIGRRRLYRKFRRLTTTRKSLEDRVEQEFAIAFGPQDRRLDRIGLRGSKSLHHISYFLDRRQLRSFVAHDATLA